jgi:hypothetical protein
MKTKMSHLVSSERTASEIIALAQSSLGRRRLWVSEESPTAAEMLKNFPRLADTPSLVIEIYPLLNCSKS